MPPSPPRRRPLPEQPRSHTLRNTVIAIGTLAALAAGGYAVLSLAFPGETVRDYLAAEVKARTGRELLVKGPATFSLVPSASVSLNDVTLSPPAGVEAPPVVTMQSIDVSVALWPLLWREVVIESVVLKDPVIDLAVDGDGQNNWTMRRTAARPAGALVRYAQAETEVTNDAGRPSPTFDALRRHNISDVALRDMRIDNGTIRYRDARSGKSQEVSAVAARLAVKSLTTPATANGTFLYRGEPVEFALEVGAIEPLLSHASSRLALKVTSRPLSARYDGSVFPANGEAEGSLSLASSSLATTARWLGAKLPQDAEWGALDVSGQLRTSGKLHTLSNARLTANGAVAQGQVALDTAPDRPLLRGDLAIGDLDLNALLTPQRRQPASSQEKTSPGDAAEPPPPATDGTRVNGYVARGGWNEDPIRLTALSVLDADLKLAVDSVQHRDIKAGASRISLALHDSVLKATIDDAALYDGRARGFIVLDGRTRDVAHVGLNLTFDGVTLRPFLQDAAKLDWLEGRGTATIAVAGSGAHQRALIQNLAGKADLKVGHGAVIGVDVNRMADNLANGRLTDLKPQPGDKTTFSGMTATWQIRDGIAHNGDLRLVSDAIQVTGSGNVSLPDRSLDYTIRPKLAVAGQQEGRGLAGLEIPVSVSGSWEKPRYKADASGAVDELGRRLKGKNTDEIVDELVGKDSETGKKAKKLLDKLFR
jgi:AsmA protein